MDEVSRRRRETGEAIRVGQYDSVATLTIADSVIVVAVSPTNSVAAAAPVLGGSVRTGGAAAAGR